MRLIVKNMGTPAYPDFTICAEDGEPIDNISGHVQFVNGGRPRAVLLIDLGRESGPAGYADVPDPERRQGAKPCRKSRRSGQ